MEEQLVSSLKVELAAIRAAMQLITEYKMDSTLAAEVVGLVMKHLEEMKDE